MFRYKPALFLLLLSFFLPLAGRAEAPKSKEHESANTTSGDRGSAGSIDPERLNLSSLLSAMREARPANKAEFLKMLPEMCRARYMWVYESRATPCASLESPRTIISCVEDRTNFVMAIDGDAPGVPKGLCNKVEVLDFNPTNGKTTSAEIRLGAKSDELPYDVVLNPPRCVSCHGTASRPIGDRYPFWPGFYQSSQRKIRSESIEGKAYHSLIERAKSDPFYGQLIPHEVRPNLDDDSFQLRLWEKHGRTETMVGQFFNKLQPEFEYRAGANIASHPEFPKFQFALAGAVLGCPSLESFIPKSFRLADRSMENLVKEIESGEKATIRRMEKVIGRYNRSEKFSKEIDYFSPMYLRRMAALGYIVEYMGIPVSSMSTALTSEEFTTPNGEENLPLLDFILDHEEFSRSVRSRQGNLSLNRAQEDFRSWLTREVKKTPGSVTLVNSKGEGRFNNSKLLTANKDLCQDLKQRSLEALKDYTPNRFLAPARGTSVPIATLLSKCVACHSQPLADRIGAEPIPFDSPDSLRTAIRANSSLADNIRRRLAAHGPQRMPPNEFLTATEVAAFNNWIRSAE